MGVKQLLILKLHVIYRITSYNVCYTKLLRGVAIHSPTFYSVDEVSDKGISSYFDKSERHNYEEQTQFSYGYRTPYRLLANGAYIFGNVATVSMDYEFCDYSFSKFSSNDNQYLSYFEAQNDQISEVYSYNFV